MDYEARLCTEEDICGYRHAAVRVMKDSAKQKLVELSIHPVLSVLSEFPIVETTPCLDF